MLNRKRDKKYPYEQAHERGIQMMKKYCLLMFVLLNLLLAGCGKINESVSPSVSETEENEFAPYGGLKAEMETAWFQGAGMNIGTEKERHFCGTMKTMKVPG